MAIATKQSFVKGVNRRFPREESTDPDHFYTLQNARLFTRGETGKVVRIPGFTTFNSLITNPDVLDLIPYENQYIVLYEDKDNSGTFHVEIINSDGTVDVGNSFSYTGESIGVGDLIRSDETVFIAPHSKVLYNDNGTWSLQDFKVSIPTITSTTLATGDGKALATIEPTSAPSQTVGTKASAEILVSENNTPYGENDVATITVGSRTTDEITIKYQDNKVDIAQKFYDALKGNGNYSDPGITNDWDISMSKEENNVKREHNRIYFTAVLAGSARNNDEITIESDFIIQGQIGSPYMPGTERDLTSQFPDFSNLILEVEGTTVVKVSQPHGGGDGSVDIGPLHIRLRNISHTVETENFNVDDTTADVANKIFNALDNDSTVKEHFTVNQTANEIQLQAIEEGKKYNGEIALRFHNPDFNRVDSVFSYTKSNFTGGEEVDANLSLDPETNYWYRVRYKYVDGQVSPTSYPVKINTGPSKGVTINFETDALDLDGTRPKIQLYRRKEGENFFLIEEETASGSTHQITDDGKFEQDSLEEVDTIWTKLHEAQEIIENRYVKANITYPTEEYTGVDFSVTTVEGNAETLPNNAKARIFVQPQYKDGTKGYFEEIGVQDINSPDQVFQVTQNGSISNADKEIEELGFFANYKSHSEKHTYEFSTIELSNQNLPTIADSSRFPARTRILFGFRYLRLFANPADDSFSTRVYPWDVSGTEDEHYGRNIDLQEINSGPISTSTGNRLPRTVTVDVLGRETEYIRIGVKLDGDTPQAIYELADIEALENAAETGDLKIRMKSTSLDSLSSSRPNDEILEQEYNVARLIDKSAGFSPVTIQKEDDRILAPPPDTRLYLEIEESVFDDIDNENITSYAAKYDYKKDLITTDITDFNFYIGRSISEVEDADEVWPVTFELTNFKNINSATFKPYTGHQNANDNGKRKRTRFNEVYYSYNWDYAEYELLTDISIANDNIAIFIGKKDNTSNTVTFNVTGFDYREEGSLFINRLRKDAIYNNLIFADSLNLDKNKLTNQIIWSDELNLGSGFSGGRNTRNEAFFHISNENGEILDILSLGNKLFVFCEEGIAQINIGEVLTQQRSGEVFVDSSAFMNNYYWINDKVINVQRESIVKYRNAIYFCDGYDVYSLSGQGLKNLTQGILDLDPSDTYYGGINPEYEEYQLCDYNNGETWVFNTVFGQWYGPFTYKFTASAYNDLDFITADDALYEHGSGNTFAGTAYTTKIENAASDRKDSFFDKNYRKFYIQTQNDTNAIFKYGKDQNSLVSVSIPTIKEKNGYKHQGIKPSENNTKSIFWTIESTDDGFELSDISWRFSPKRRR